MRRAFADIAEGQVHYWHGGTGGQPLLVLHPGPGTARHQVPLLDVFAASRQVIAPDIMGMGDSSPPPADRKQPDLTYFADAVVRMLDALSIDTVDLFGSSLGGRVAVALALAHPTRVRRLVLNRLMIQTGPALAAMRQYHAPAVVPDETGAYIQFVWQRCRDLYIYFPWFKRTAATVKRADLPPAEVLHISFIEHIKMCRTSHMAFTAYWDYPIAEALPRLAVPTLARDDTARMIPGAETWTPTWEGDPLTATRAQLETFAAPIVGWLDRT